MAGRGGGGGLTISSGQRGYKRYLYGTHYWVPEVQADWSAGMVRDVARTDIPQNGAYDIADFLCHIPGQLIRRGGSVGAGTLSATNYCKAVAYAQYPAGAKLIAVNEIGHIFNVLTNTDLGGSTVTTVDKPKFRVGGAKNLLVFTNSDGTTSPVKYDGTAAPAALGGTPPAGKYAELYKSRLALAAGNTNPNRIYFSPTPDIESTWDTTNSWIDCDHAVTGMAALQNALLVFSLGSTERITGSTPPPNTDMDRQPIGEIGCSDARSIVIYQGNAIFANPSGVYRTNGVSFECLTEKGGISSLWRSFFSPLTYDPATWTVAAGVHGDFLLVNVLDNTGALQLGLLCYLPTLAWVRTTNIAAVMYAAAPPLAELYYAARDSATVPKMSGVFAPSPSLTGNDFNSVAIQPQWETRAFGGSSSLKAFGDVTADVDYMDLSVPVAGNIQVSMTRGPVGAGGATPPGSPWSPSAFSGNPPQATQTYQCAANVDDRWVSFKFSQNAASAETIFRALAVYTRGYTLEHLPAVE